LLPLRAASLVLEVASLAAVVVMARLLTNGQGRRLWAVGAAAMLVSSGARAALANGQTDLVALAAVMLAARWHPVLALAKPQTTGPTAAALFLAPGKRSWWARLPLAVAGVVVVSIATVLLAGETTWARWFELVGTREETPIDHVALLGLATALGVGVLVAGLARARAHRRLLDVVALAALSGSLVAVMGGWNPWWHLAQAIGLASLLLGVRAGVMRPTGHQSALLVVAVAAMAGDGYSAYSAGTSFRLWVPVLGVACLMVALVAWRELSPTVATMVVALNAGITAVPLGQGDRTIVAVLVSVVLLHLTLALRPAPARWVVAATT
jgi:Glycosyltransferase family 87